ncbi:hypothetical protein [Thermosyntropha sp.]|uniref:hypothetical protein n=1 Tax=Thermosyntropha sp. TaxID=2740820 RepID=UPI0025F4788F|nr:hypothetical protein [Thermosyntropha sp.]MBO8159190.1 hypothetical protein [Thermosyntropha sp.]
MTRYIQRENLLSGLIAAFFTFFIALILSLGSETLVRAVNNVLLAVVLLLLVILTGIFFDVIGTAATAADLPPFNAKAAKKVKGAKQAVKIIKNANVVANFCNDVIGDIAGTLSGAIGAGIVVSIAEMLNFIDIVLLGALVTSFIAALTVGGKAIGKSIAVNKANDIIYRVALIMSWWERVTGVELFKDRR